MFNIPYLLVAGSALMLTVVLLTHDEKIRVPIKVYAISSVLTFFMYVYFAFWDTTVLQKQFMARSNEIVSDLALIIILLMVRRKQK
jgi:hypothetical protein